MAEERLKEPLIPLSTDGCEAWASSDLIRHGNLSAAHLCVLFSGKTNPDPTKDNVLFSLSAFTVTWSRSTNLFHTSLCVLSSSRCEIRRFKKHLHIKSEYTRWLSYLVRSRAIDFTRIGCLILLFYVWRIPERTSMQFLLLRAFMGRRRHGHNQLSSLLLGSISEPFNLILIICLLWFSV